MQKPKVFSHTKVKVYSHINCKLAVKKQNMVSIMRLTCDFDHYAQKPNLLKYNDILQCETYCIKRVYVRVAYSAQEHELV